ncbi:hypothetical protein ASE85_11170 [Sphingobium sp. Leaf26]|uniref:transcriptional regulator domain-containing protein n=1 Tax=Sphingobium sp. Leaf26 TaxID=1735693 RepID=UPI0006F28A91|nr:DUF6499 domain-containing protein [Sphingobium sp. Leaf26]KQM99259.1 hypothetical protein ASE85_11170 [Sphingobium sp. Leaf26]
MTVPGRARLDRLSTLARSGRAGLAWEIRRRDPAYRSAVLDLADQPTGAVISASFTADWGLHFR